jgi:hypothetical protein
MAHEKADAAALERRRELVMDDFAEDWQYVCYDIVLFLFFIKTV